MPSSLSRTSFERSISRPSSASGSSLAKCSSAVSSTPVVSNEFPPEIRGATLLPGELFVALKGQLDPQTQTRHGLYDNLGGNSRVVRRERLHGMILSRGVNDG